MRKLYFALISLVIMLSACDSSSTVPAKELVSYIEQHLEKGDSEDKVIEFLESRDWPYSYDRFKNTYQTRDPSEDGQLSGNQVYLYLDDAKNFLRVEVEVWTNAL